MKKLRRRSFFGRLLAGAAAFVVAPVVGTRETEAAPVDKQNAGYFYDPMTKNVWPASAEDESVSGYALLCDRGLATWDQVIAASAPLSFEAMAADCAARGCVLVQEDADMLRHDFADGHSAWSGSLSYYFSEPEPVGPVSIARVDAWRQRLHAQGRLELWSDAASVQRVNLTASGDGGPMFTFHNAGKFNITAPDGRVIGPGQTWKGGG